MQYHVPAVSQMWTESVVSIGIYTVSFTFELHSANLFDSYTLHCAATPLLHRRHEPLQKWFLKVTAGHNTT
jgi:hypothetical protein